MNVGMIVMSYYPELCGGAEHQCRRLSEELVRRGHSVKILTTRACRGTPSQAVYNGVEVICISRMEAFFSRQTRMDKKYELSEKESPSKTNLPRFAYFKKWAANTVYFFNILNFFIGSAWTMWRLRNEVDVWHAHVAGLYSGWCAFFAKRFGIQIVCKGANLPVFPPEPRMPMKNWLGKMRRQMHFIALTTEMSDDLIANGVPKEQIVIIPNGVLLPSEGPRSDPGEGGNVLYVANFTQPVANKAFDVLFDAWVKIHIRCPYAKLTVAGAGSTTLWREYLRIRNAEESVLFLGHVDDLAASYRLALMLVLPSRREGISNALLEAQSWGVPAVVSDIPGNRAVINDGENGLIVSEGSPDELASAILFLLNESKTRIQMSLRARKRITEQFSMDRITEKYLELYADLIQLGYTSSI